MKKFLSILALLALVLIGWASPSEADEVQSEPIACVGQITGDGTATTNGHCLLLAYRYADGAPGPDQFATSVPQTLFDTDGPGEVLTVSLPDCFWQVDLVSEDAVVADPLTDYYYGPNGWLVASAHGGDGPCEPPVVEPRCESNCEPTTTTTVPETTTTVPVTTTVPPCQEGDDCFDCATMGNLICGTTTVAPPTTVATAPPQELPRTGIKDGQFLIALGMVMSGVGFVVYSRNMRRV